MTFHRRTFLAVFAALFLGAAPVVAATVVADEAVSGEFGNNPNQSAVFGKDVGTVIGGQKNNGDSDFLFFDGFEDGTTSLDFSFTNVGGNWGGLNLRIKDEAFKNKNDWWSLEFGASYDKISDSTPLKISFALDGYTGPLAVAVDFFNADFKNGNGVSYVITKSGGLPPSNAPAPIPLPAGLPLAATGLGALVLARRFRRKR
ncbi:VPLPA-CTERM sorting domain-containing protein [Fluviibacterium sp. DFM31]|uniref:VPLPA-CTERM sorting domain-containing protein n=1 Tax=Meridianimarinicoccus marinus TaxID=3231483 RepID=A0ABV3L9W6_9RHOB